MPSPLARHRLRSALLGAACVRLPSFSSGDLDFEAALAESLVRIRERAQLAGQVLEEALKGEFRDRLVGQLVLFLTILACLGAAVSLALASAPAWLSGLCATFPAALWLSVQVLANRVLLEGPH